MEFRTRRKTIDGKTKNESESPRKKSRTLNQENSKFEPGAKCLCYEPDVSKVKVLYDAKVFFFFKYSLRLCILSTKL
jgi:hypothetical protein